MLFDCGKDHTLVVINGELYACGNNKYGQLGFNVSFDVKTFTKVPYSFDESGIKSVKCGDGFSLVLTNSGNLYACGYNDFKDHIHRLKYYDETSSEDYDYYYEWNYNNGSYNDYEEHYCDDICLHTFVQLSNLNDISFIDCHGGYIIATSSNKIYHLGKYLMTTTPNQIYESSIPTEVECDLDYIYSINCGQYFCIILDDSGLYKYEYYHDKKCERMQFSEYHLIKDVHCTFYTHSIIISLKNSKILYIDLNKNNNPDEIIDNIIDPYIFPNYPYICIFDKQLPISKIYEYYSIHNIIKEISYQITNIKYIIGSKESNNMFLITDDHKVYCKGHGSNLGINDMSCPSFQLHDFLTNANLDILCTKFLKTKSANKI